jgi:hypothetical protein
LHLKLLNLFIFLKKIIKKIINIFIQQMSESTQPKLTVNSILQRNVASFEEKYLNNKAETVYTINIRNL